MCTTLPTAVDPLPVKLVWSSVTCVYHPIVVYPLSTKRHDNLSSVYVYLSTDVDPLPVKLDLLIWSSVTFVYHPNVVYPLSTKKPNNLSSVYVYLPTDIYPLPDKKDLLIYRQYCIPPYCCLPLFPDKTRAPVRRVVNQVPDEILNDPNIKAAVAVVCTINMGLYMLSFSLCFLLSVHLSNC